MWTTPCSCRLPPGNTRYPLYRRLVGPQGQSGWVWKISPPPGLVSLAFQPVASRYTNWAILALRLMLDMIFIHFIIINQAFRPSLSCGSKWWTIKKKVTTKDWYQYQHKRWRVSDTLCCTPREINLTEHQRLRHVQDKAERACWQDCTGQKNVEKKNCYVWSLSLNCLKENMKERIVAAHSNAF